MLNEPVDIFNSGILIVDDQEDLADVTRQFLELFGFNNIMIANNCKKALEILDTVIVDLILMDINLNDKCDGIDLINQIRKKHEVAVIYLTGRFDDTILNRAKDTNPAGYLIKPYEKNMLRAQVEIALHNQKISKENLTLRNALIQTIYAMEKTVAIKDPYTAHHQSRVSKLAEAIALEMGLDNNTVEGIKYAGLVHEFGKIFVPAEILSKPGKLSEVQFNFIKEHPLKGYEALTGINFPWPLAEIVLQHHERMDGSGYPLGLSGEEIRIEARILAVADVVSSITTYKSYRPARSLKAAIEEIKRNINNDTGQNIYDTEVTAACINLFSTNLFSFSR